MTPTPAASSEPTRSRMDYIDALRGIACLWVLLHHSLEHHPVAPGLSHLPLKFIVRLADLGWLGVSLFLVLSGFCLYYPLVRRAEVWEVQLDLKTFAARRAWRILPPYYAAVVLYSVVQVAMNYHHHLALSTRFRSWYDIPIHFLMLHNLRHSTFGSINPAFWSLALESQLYIVFPLLIMLTARRGLLFMLCVTFVIALSWQLVAFHHLGFSWRGSSLLGTWYHALPARCFEFAMGMAAAAVWVARPGQIQIRICSLVAALLLLPCLGYALLISRFGPLLDPMWGILFACIIVLLNEIPSQRFQTNPLLRFLTWTGAISYSLYLIHNMVFKVELPESSDAVLVALVLARMAVAIGVAYGFFLIFERPFIRGRKKTTADLVEATVLSPAP